MEEVEAASCRFAKQFPSYFHDCKAPRLNCKRLGSNGRVAPASNPAESGHRGPGRRGRMPRLRGTTLRGMIKYGKITEKNGSPAFRAVVGVQPSGCALVAVRHV